MTGCRALWYSLDRSPPRCECRSVARTRLRTLRIDDAEYRWVVRHRDAHRVELRVWPADPTRGVCVQVLVRFDDPWLNYPELLLASPEQRVGWFVFAPVTPRLVEHVVHLVTASGWPLTSSMPTRFALDSAQTLVQLTTD